MLLWLIGGALAALAPPPPGPNEEFFEYEEPLEIFNEEIDLDAYDATEAPITTTQPPFKEVNRDSYSSIGSSSSSESFVPYMTGGVAADPGEYPFIARMSLRDPNLGFYCAAGRCGLCGATLISAGNSKSGKPAYLMTAGHCCAELNKNIYRKSNIWPLAKNITKYDITFELGAVYDKTCNNTQLCTKTKNTYEKRIPGMDYKAKKLFIHPQFTTKSDWDYCIAEIDPISEEHLAFEYKGKRVIEPISFGEEMPPGGTECTILGWGLVNNWSGKQSSDLLAGNLTSLSTDECIKAYAIYRKFQRRIPFMRRSKAFCAIDKFHKGLDRVDSCRGDSGGPLVCKNTGSYRLYGMTSGGLKNCGGTHGGVPKPGIYANVPHVAEWIKNITGLGAGEYQPYDLVDADCDQKCASNSSEIFYDYNGYCDGCKGFCCRLDGVGNKCSSAVLQLTQHYFPTASRHYCAKDINDPFLDPMESTEPPPSTASTTTSTTTTTTSTTTISTTSTEGCQKITGGSAEGECCHFPFYFGGKAFYDCTTFGRLFIDQKRWCSATEHYTGKWGFCE